MALLRSGGGRWPVGVLPSSGIDSLRRAVYGADVYRLAAGVRGGMAVAANGERRSCDLVQPAPGAIRRVAVLQSVDSLAGGPGCRPVRRDPFVRAVCRRLDRCGIGVLRPLVHGQEFCIPDCDCRARHDGAALALAETAWRACAVRSGGGVGAVRGTMDSGSLTIQPAR